MKNRINELLNIKYPIIQAGMVWCSGWKLASAVSNAGGLGLIGAGSMYPDVLEEHLIKCKSATDKSFGVNVPLLYPDIEKLMEIIVEHKVPIVFTSAGNPKIWTEHLKSRGIRVVHVVSSLKFALKSQDAGVDAVVGEGFEAGGHNGKDETTTMCLIPEMAMNLSIPVIAAGGIASGKAMLAAMALGAEAVQVGTRFAVSKESSAHENFKNRIIEAKEGDTILTLKEITPVRLIKNNFYEQILNYKKRNASIEELKNLLGRARAKKGIFEGDLDEGELEIGQISSSIQKIEPAATILKSIWEEFLKEKQRIIDLKI
ncbi:nitronate monooxygenase [Hyphobacterium sp. CCMP332]|nr:nitronate monooxygenase [Hyphobacterium sp. CCMP332]